MSSVNRHWKAWIQSQRDENAFKCKANRQEQHQVAHENLDSGSYFKLHGGISPNSAQLLSAQIAQMVGLNDDNSNIFSESFSLPGNYLALQINPNIIECSHTCSTPKSEPNEEGKQK